MIKYKIRSLQTNRLVANVYGNGKILMVEISRLYRFKYGFEFIVRPSRSRERIQILGDITLPPATYVNSLSVNDETKGRLYGRDLSCYKFYLALVSLARYYYREV